jgi:PilZ domain
MNRVKGWNTRHICFYLHEIYANLRALYAEGRKSVMADKRDSKRHRKRLTLKFGLQETDRIAFTEDISPLGMFIKTANVVAPGSMIKIDLTLGAESMVSMEARVMWAKRVPANMVRLVKKSGMGVRIVRITAGEEPYIKLCNELHER